MKFDLSELVQQKMTSKNLKEREMDKTKNTYVEEVVAHIKNAIFSGQYQPGDKVKEQVIASELHISRSPVREALLQLTNEGLLETRLRRGKVVVSLTRKQILDSYIMGGILEGYALASTFHLFFDSDYKKLESLLMQMHEIANGDGDLKKLSALDTEFHDTLLSKADNELLLNFSEKTSRRIAHFLLFRHWAEIQDLDEVCEKHSRLIDIMKEGNPEKIESAIRTHYMETGYIMAAFGSDIK